MQEMLFRLSLLLSSCHFPTQLLMVLLRKSSVTQRFDLVSLLVSSGVMVYTTLNGLTYIIKLISFGRIIPADEDLKEYWTCMFHLARTHRFPSNCSVSHFQISQETAESLGSCASHMVNEDFGMLSLVTSQTRSLTR